MTSLEVSLYSMDNACRMRITNLSRVDELPSETLLEDLARILNERTFTVACSPNAREMIVFLRNIGLKKVIAEKSNCEKLKLGGVTWYVLTNFGTDRPYTRRGKIEIQAYFFYKIFRFCSYQNGQVI